MRIQVSPLTKKHYFHLRLDLVTSDFEQLKLAGPLETYYAWSYFKADTVHNILSLDVYENCFFLVTIHDQVFELIHQININSQSHNKFMNLCNYCTLLSNLL